jgi:hypothetical protein
MCPTGGGNVTLRKYIRKWGISTEHFDPNAARVEALRRAHEGRPLEAMLVEASTASRGNLKRRLYAAGLKQRVCELCGQDELWRGQKMALILDHINGVSNDHRLENLQIICPNCAATLPTHCGRNIPRERICVLCAKTFAPNRPEQRYCSPGCGINDRCTGPKPERRKVERPALDVLLAEIERLGYVAVAKKYGVSDNAIRKWLRVDGIEPPRRTWPNRRRGSGATDGPATPPGSARRRGPGPGRAGPPRSR